MNGNIYLTGFMGAGKSTVGPLLAKALNRIFVDMDSRLEKRIGMPISRFFAEQGETAFRDRESGLLRELAGHEGLVVATGGGAVVDVANRELMAATGRLVCLKTDLATSLSRMSPENLAVRPLFSDENAAARLLEGRREIYSQCDLTAATRNLSPDQVVEGIIAGLWPDETFEVEMDGRSCPVRATMNAPGAVAEVLRERAEGRQTVILTDAKVGRLHLDRYLAALPGAEVITVRGGERAKSLASAERIYRRLLELGIQRSDTLIAVGGGVVTDLGAYVAATFKRGINFVLVSTSLLGCVDAAVGGKAAVNLGRVKNIIGCFTVPRAVVLDGASLATLPLAGVREGLVEAYKTGLVADSDLARLVEDQGSVMLNRDLPTLFRVAAASARAKAGVVGSDFTETGRRAILNLGHTYGHAVETWHRYGVSHGRAVALGIKVATRISVNRGLLAGETGRRIVDIIDNLAPGAVELPPLEEAWRLMAHDKKNRNGKLIYVLLAGIGRPEIVDDLSPAELERAVGEAQPEA